MKIQRLPLGPAWASNQINATVFRVNAVVSAGKFQYATWFNPQGQVVVAQRTIGSEKWNLAVVPGAMGNVKDAHNGAVLGVSGDGIVHLSYDHHSNPLRYQRTARPHDITSFGPRIAMTGKTEAHVTYPQFVTAPDGGLYFFFRDGGSGNGNLCLNRYDSATKAWSVVHHPLIDGQNKCNPYWWRPSIGPDGTLNLAWCWRDSGDARTNHDVSFMRSRDRGVSWYSAEAVQQSLPVVRGAAPVADPIATGSGLINQCSSAVDMAGHPHLAHYQNDANGIPQYTHLWHDGYRWQRNIVSARTERFVLGGGGTLEIPISRPEIAISKKGEVYFITRDRSLGNNIRVFHAPAPYTKWTTLDLTPPNLPASNLGEWEPSYDTVRWREAGILSLFVLPVRQGNHETVTDFGPQEAHLLDVQL